MAKAANEFSAGLTKYTSKKLTYKGVDGRLWTKWTKQDDGAWLHTGENYVRSGASEDEVMVSFYSQEIDHDAVDAYWDAQ